MRGEHIVAFAIGVVVGWLVVPMVLNLVGGAKQGG